MKQLPPETQQQTGVSVTQKVAKTHQALPQVIIQRRILGSDAPASRFFKPWKLFIDKTALLFGQCVSTAFSKEPPHPKTAPENSFIALECTSSRVQDTVIFVWNYEDKHVRMKIN